MKITIPSRRQMIQNIWTALLCATDQEIRDGMDFYPGAYGLCKFLSLALKNNSYNPDLTVNQLAGIYAALSPLNTWDTNVSNIIDIVRQGPNAKVNTPSLNRIKALSILYGREPLKVLSGRKVVSFYKAISNPDDSTPIAIDRHLFCLALGLKITDNFTLSRIIGSNSLYSQVESIYAYLGEREKLYNRLASIAWFVQRRINGTKPLPHPEAPFCCNKPMGMQRGLHTPENRKYSCFSCKRSIIISTVNLIRKYSQYIDGYRIGYKQGRKIIYLHKSHQFANSGGWQYLSRYLVMKELNRKLLSDEHVDHIDQNKSNDKIDNYQLLLAEQHGKKSITYRALLGVYRDDKGRFIELDQPMEY